MPPFHVLNNDLGGGLEVGNKHKKGGIDVMSVEFALPSPKNQSCHSLRTWWVRKFEVAIEIHEDAVLCLTTVSKANTSLGARDCINKTPWGTIMYFSHQSKPLH